MANRYVYSGATGTGTGADWTNAHVTLAAAITAAAGAAGTTYYVAHDHAETIGAAKTLTFNGVHNQWDMVFCVDRAGSVPPVAADLRKTAFVGTTGSSALSVNGYIHAYGITWKCGSSTSAAVLRVGGDADAQLHEECTFILGGTGASKVDLGSQARCKIVCINPTFTFNSTSQFIGKSGWVEIVGPATATMVTGPTIPDILIKGTGQTGNIRIDGADLSNIGSGKSLVMGFPDNGPTSILVNCKLDPAVTIQAGHYAPHVQPITVQGCGSTGASTRNETHSTRGSQFTETTIVRTGGANDGVTGFSWKLVGSANVTTLFPQMTLEGNIWNDAVGSAKTLTIHIVNDGTALTDADIWVEVDYLGSSANPMSTRVTDRAATRLTAGVAQPTDTATWTTTGLASPVKQKLEVTFTPQMKGLVRWRVGYTVPNGTVYVCPKADLI